jgi:hypothetical protein
MMRSDNDTQYLTVRSRSRGHPRQENEENEGEEILLKVINEVFIDLPVIK